MLVLCTLERFQPISAFILIEKNSFRSIVLLVKISALWCGGGGRGDGGGVDFNSKLTSYKKQQKFTSIKFDVIRNHTLTTPENYTTTIPYAIPDATDKIAIFWKINNPLKSNLKSTKFFAMSLTRNKFLYLKGKQCFALKRFRLWCFQCFTIFKIYVTTDITVYKKLHFRLY